MDNKGAGASLQFARYFKWVSLPILVVHTVAEETPRSTLTISLSD